MRGSDGWGREVGEGVCKLTKRGEGELEKEKVGKVGEG